ncbi:MAG: hemin uptake protein HemP [Burkholderiales bacterium]
MSSKPVPPKPVPPSDPPAPRVSSAALLGAGRQLVILHNGREYVLRLTQAGKLILTA